LIDKLGNDLGLDLKRVYVAGFSAGAIMAYRLAAQLSDQLAGIAVVEGTMSNKQPDGSWITIPNPTSPVAAIIFHGKQDTHIPYNGGQGNGAGKLYVRPVTDAVSALVKSDGCSETPTTITSGDGNVTRQVYNSCAAGSEVIFYSIVNGQHEWPSVKHNGISATSLIWEFFRKQSK
jgi:polyhydroxybutyrate depolymerase